MWLRKSRAPGSAPGGYSWTTAEDAVEVPDDLGLELLAIRDAGFSEVAPPIVAPDPEPSPEPDEDKGDSGEEPDAPAPARRVGRPRKTPVSD